jgi:nucleoside permease NupC
MAKHPTRQPRARALPQAGEHIGANHRGGFANFGHAGIMLGGIGMMIPERRAEVVQLEMRSIISGTLANCMSGAVAGAIGG